jgi:lysine-specific permease
VSNGVVDWGGMVAAYIGLPLFLGLWIWYKVKHKTKVIDLKEVDLEYNEN